MKKAHLGIRVPCNVCQKEFSDNSKMLRHKREVHGNTLLKCKFDGCDFKSKHSDSVWAHFTRKHDVEFFE